MHSRDRKGFQRRAAAQASLVPVRQQLVQHGSDIALDADRLLLHFFRAEGFQQIDAGIDCPGVLIGHSPKRVFDDGRRVSAYRPACFPAAASLYRGYLSCVPSIFLSAAVLPEKASCLVVASCVSLVSPQAAKLTCSAAPPLPTKPYGFAGAPTIAACSGVGTLPATSGHFVPKSDSLRCFPSLGIPFRTVILFSRCRPSMNYPKSTRKKCNSRNIARIAF